MSYLKMARKVAFKKLTSYLNSHSETLKTSSSADEIFIDRYEEIVEAVLSDDEIVASLIESMVNMDSLRLSEDDGGIYYEGRRINN